MLPLSCRSPGFRDPGGDGYLQGHHARNLVQPHGPGGSPAESGLRRGRSERDRPRGLVPVAEHDPDALSRPRELHGMAVHSGRSRGELRRVRLLLRKRAARRAGDGGDPFIDEVLQPEDIGLVEERAARHAHARLPARPLPGGPERLGSERSTRCITSTGWCWKPIAGPTRHERGARGLPCREGRGRHRRLRRHRHRRLRAFRGGRRGRVRDRSGGARRRGCARHHLPSPRRYPRGEAPSR